MSRCCDWFIQEEMQCVPQFAHNGFVTVTHERRSRFFYVRTTKKTRVCFRVFRLRTVCFLQNSRGTGISKVFPNREYHCYVIFVIVWYRRLQHTFTERKGSSCLRYYIYFIPSYAHVNDATASGYGEPFFIQPSVTYSTDNSNHDGSAPNDIFFGKIAFNVYLFCAILTTHMYVY